MWPQHQCGGWLRWLTEEAQRANNKLSGNALLINYIGKFIRRTSQNHNESYRFYLLYNNNDVWVARRWDKIWAAGAGTGITWIRGHHAIFDSLRRNGYRRWIIFKDTPMYARPLQTVVIILEQCLGVPPLLVGQVATWMWDINFVMHFFIKINYNW